ncbi:hypothetical protein ABW21_db0206816 [Orbilia brochopaga]|nr:hypothetical protein ABW21_db0206816 [Drechslerella brochopaga]
MASNMHTTDSTESNNVLSLKLEESDTVIRVDDNLEIRFHRTIRVPDNQQVSGLPPDLGAMTLTNVKHLSSQLPPEMKAKGGLLLGMHQNEAMWISFKARSRGPKYAIKIFAGGINVISGEPETETTATKLRRQNLLAEEKSVQDYVIAPDQLWLDGIATAAGHVRQFIATSLGDGLTVEGQTTGSEDNGGLQFEITPQETHDYHYLVNRLSGKIRLFIRTLRQNLITIECTPDWPIGALMEEIENREKVSVDKQRLIFGGKQLEPENDRKLSYYNIQDLDTIHLVLRMRGGGRIIDQSPSATRAEMGLAAGGTIKQFIFKDTLNSDQWLGSKTTRFNVQILNATLYKAITGLSNPNSPLPASVYAKHGGVFFDLRDEEESDIHGNFSDVKSIGQLTHTKSENLAINSFKIYRNSARRLSASSSEGEGGAESAGSGYDTTSHESKAMLSSEDSVAAPLTAVDDTGTTPSEILPAAKQPTEFRSVRDIEQSLQRAD